MMKKVVQPIILIFLIIILVSVDLCPAQTENELQTKIDDFLTGLTKNGFSGVVFVAKDGAILLSKGYGVADRERSVPITNQTVFTVGSITKQFTGAAILKLQMLGKLDVHDPIIKYFKDVPEDKKEITLHHLLTHTAGFPGAIGDDYEEITRDQFIKLAMSTKLQRTSGLLYEYSNVGYSLLGAIIEIITGKSYEAFLNEYLFQPAGMTKTGYRIPRRNPADLAHGYRGEKDWGTSLDKPWAEDGPYWHLRANGGILSTVEDMYQWHLALQGEKILSEDAKKLYYTPHVREGEDADSFYGYGWTIFTTPRNTRLIAHNGGNGIFAADFLRYLDENVVIIGMSNTSGKPAWKATNQVARIMFGYDYSDPFAEQALQAEMDNSFSPDDDLAQLAQKWGLPNSSTGRRAAALLETISRKDENYTQDFIQSNFAPGFLKSFPLEMHLKQFQRMQENMGEFQLLKAIKTGPNAARLKLRSNDSGRIFSIEMEVEPDEPYRIAGIGVDVEE
jgi:CubicO group peptidase (beta-lactamase class C family)